MSDQDMINAILNAIQTQSNLLILLQLSVQNNLPNVSTAELQQMCQVLGIATS